MIYLCPMHIHQYYFEKLHVWQNARNLINRIYKVTKEFPNNENFHLTSQMRRSVSSVASNIAEGQGRRTKKDQAHFTSIAYSSLIELVNHLITARDQEYLEIDEYVELRKQIDKIGAQLSALKRVQEAKINHKSTQ